MRKERLNICDLKATNFAIPTDDLQKIKGGLGDPPPIGGVPPDFDK
jgi:hypothetical protein